MLERPIVVSKEDWVKFDSPEKVLKAYGPEWGGLLLMKSIDIAHSRDAFMSTYDAGFGDRVVQKADNPLLTTTTGNLYRGLGVKLWININTEANLFALFRKEPWGTGSEGGVSGWRVITGASTVLGHMTEETDNKPDSDSPSFAQIFDDPRTADKTLDSSLANIKEAGRNQAVAWTQYVQYMTMEYKWFICEQLAKEIGDNAAKDFVPLDQIVSNYDEFTNCATIQAKGDLASKFYNSTVDRSGSTGWYDAYVAHNGETLRALTLNLVDGMIEGVRNLSGKYETEGYVFLTGVDTQKRLKQLTRGHKRVTTEMYSTNPSSGLRQISGQKFGFELNRYDNIPIFISRHIKATMAPVGGITPLYMIHMPSISFWVDTPIIYTEHGTLFGEDTLVNAHKQIGWIFMRGDMHAYYFLNHGKLRDIKEI